MNYAEESLKLHYQWKGKLEVTPRASVSNKEELSLAYTPGVARDSGGNVQLVARRAVFVRVFLNGNVGDGGQFDPCHGFELRSSPCVALRHIDGWDAGLVRGGLLSFFRRSFRFVFTGEKASRQGQSEKQDDGRF